MVGETLTGLLTPKLLLHEYEVAPDAVNELDPPLQIVADDGEIEVFGACTIVTLRVSSNATGQSAPPVACK